MDNGEVIVALNEDWTFAGATLTEWMSGFVVFMLSSELFDKVSRSMPILLFLWIGTTLLLAALRKSFPDEERGLRNKLSVLFGITPPGLPAPAELQPIWSGAPLRELSNRTRYSELQLDDVLFAGDAGQQEKIRGYVPQLARQTG